MKIDSRILRWCCWSAPPAPASRRFAAQAFPADRGRLVGRLPRHGRRRRDRSDRSPATRSTLLHYVVEKRLKHRKLDGHRCHQRPAGGAQGADRPGAQVSRARRRHRVRPAASELAIARNTRSARPPVRRRHVVRSQHGDLSAWHARPAARGLPLGPSCCDRARRSMPVEIDRTPLWADKRDEAGPFDIIGDVHGCADELESCSASSATPSPGMASDESAVTAAQGRRAIFVGDLVDRGPRSPDVLRIVMHMVAAGAALCVVGNHDDKLKRQLSAAMSRSPMAWARRSISWPPETARVRAPRCDSLLDDLVSHYVLDGGKLVVAHAGLKEEMHGRASARCAVRHVRRDHRRDRRVRPAGALQLGGRLPGQGQGRLWPHAGAGSANGSTTPSASTPAACSAAS